jgi:hypothetical protein
MGTSHHRRRGLRIAALTLSAGGAVLMGHGAAGAAVTTRPMVAHPATADTESHGRRRHDDRDAHHDHDRTRSHATHEHESHGSHAGGDHDRRSSDAAHPPGGEIRDPGCGDGDSSDTNCSGDRGADRGTAHHASGVATGRVRASAPAPAPAPAAATEPGAPASAASRPAPPDPETAPPASPPRTAAPGPVIPATGALDRIGIGLLLCLAGLVGLALARRPSRFP